METLAYSHLATAEENSTVESSVGGVNWNKFSSLGMMGILSAATVLGALSATANTASANCYDPCSGGGGGYDKGYGQDYEGPEYRHASYGKKRSSRHNLSYGSRGYKVSKLQNQLGEMGYFHHHRATGYFGPKTKRAVKAFQRDHGLRADGIVGPRTMSALGDY
jgi:hypothetical protein